MSMPDNCPLCGEAALRTQPVDSVDAYLFDCGECGGILTTRGLAVKLGWVQLSDERARLEVKAQSVRRQGRVFDLTREDSFAGSELVRRIADWREPVALEFPNDAECPRCRMPASLDLTKWPPTRQRDVLSVGYVCPNGHRFSVDHPLK